MSTYSPDDCDGCCVSCCCSGCSLLGYAFCVKKMRRSIRIKLCFIYLGILCVTLSAITATVIFGPYDSRFTPTDMRWITNRISYIFCNGVTVSTSDNHKNSFSAYLLDSKPEINETSRQTFQAETTVFIDINSYIYNRFHLLSGSIINISACVDSFVQMYIIQGKKNFNDFIENNFNCDGCFKSVIPIIKSKCSKPSDFTATSYHVTNSADYYILYVSPASNSWLTTKYHIDRTLYDVSTSLHYCSLVNYCDLSISLSEEYIVVQVSNSNTLDDIGVVTECSARIWVYVLIFFIGPYFVAVLISWLIYKHCKDPDPTEIHSERPTANIRTPLLNGYNIYQSAENMGPPKYEDIIRTTEEKPPSYDEAVGPIN